MKAKWWVAALAAVALLWAAATLASRGLTGYGPVLRANWGVSIPAAAGCRQVYEADSGPSPFGDGLRCHVFTAARPERLLAMAAWRVPTAEEQARAENLLDRLLVTPEFWPEDGRCLFWSAVGESDPRDELLLFLDEERGLLYVLESFL